MSDAYSSDRAMSSISRTSSARSSQVPSSSKSSSRHSSQGSSRSSIPSKQVDAEDASSLECSHHVEAPNPPPKTHTRQDSAQVVQRALRALKANYSGNVDLSSLSFTSDEMMAMCHILGSKRGVQFVDFTLSTFPSSSGALLLNAIKMNPTPIESVRLEGCPLPNKWKALIEAQTSSNTERALRRAAVVEQTSSAAADLAYRKAALEGSQHLLTFFKQSMKRLQVDEHNEWRVVMAAANQSLSAVQSTMHRQAVGSKFSVYFQVLTDREEVSRSAIEAMALQTSYSDCLLGACREYERILFGMAMVESRHLWKRFGSSFTVAATHTRARIMERRVDGAEVFAEALAGRIPIVKLQIEERASITSMCNTERARVRQGDVEKVQREDERRRKIRHSLRDEGQAMDHSWMRRKFADEDGVLPPSHSSALMDSDIPNIAILREELFDHEIEIRKQLTAFEASVFKGVLQIRKYYDRLASARRRVSELSGLYWSCLRETPIVMYRVSNTARECTLYERTSPFVAIEPEATLNVTVGALWPVRMSLLRNDLNKWLPQLRAARQDVGPLILALLLQIIKDYRLAGVGEAQWVADLKADVRDAPDYTAVEETLQVSVSDIQATKERLFIGEISYTLPPELKRLGRLGFGTPHVTSNDIQSSTELSPHAKMHHELLAASGQVLEGPKGPSLPLPHWGVRISADGASLSVTIPTGATQDTIESHLRQVVFVPVWSSYYGAYSNQRHLKTGGTDLLIPDTLFTSGRRRSLCPTRTESMNSTSFLVESPIVAPIQMSMKLFTLKKRRFTVSMFSSDQNVGEQPEKLDGMPQLLRSYVSLAKGTPTKSNTPNKVSTPLAKLRTNQVPVRKKYCFPSCQLTERSVDVSVVVLPEPVSILVQQKTRHDAKSGLWHVVPPSTLRLCEPPSVKRGNTKISLLPPKPTATPQLSTSDAVSKFLLAQNVAHSLEEGATSATDESVSRPWHEAFTDPAASTPQYALPTKSVFSGLHIRVRFPQRSQVPMEDEVALVPSPHSVPLVEVDAEGDSIYMVPDWGCLPALEGLMKEGYAEWLAAHSVRLRVASLSLVGGEISVSFVDEPYVTGSVVRGVLNALVYRNNSVDPTYGVRRVAVEITNPRFFVHHTAYIELDVYAADDPPEMESGMPSMLTAPSVSDGDVGLMAAADGVVSLTSLKANLPSAHRDVFGSVRIVDDDTAFFSGGHLTMELRKGTGTDLSLIRGIGLFIDVPCVGGNDTVGRTGLVLQTESPIHKTLPQGAPAEAWLRKMSEARALAGPKTKLPAPPSALSKVGHAYEAVPAEYFPSLSVLLELVKENTAGSPPASPVVAASLPVTIPQMVAPSTAKLFDDGVHIADIEFGEELGEHGIHATRTLTNRIQVSFVGGCAATLDCVQELLRRVRFLRDDRPKRWLLQVGVSELSVDDYTKFVASNPVDEALETVAALEFLPGPTAGRKDVEGKDVPGEACLEPLCAEVTISHAPTPLVMTSVSVGPLIVSNPAGAVLPFDGTLAFSEGFSLGGGYVRVEMVSGVEDGDQIHILPTSVPSVELKRQPSSPTRKNQPDPADTHSVPIIVDPGLYTVPVYRRNRTHADLDTRQLLALHVFTKQFLTANDPLCASQSMGEGTILGERTMSLFHSLLISASANRRSRHFAHVGFDPLSSLDPGPPSLDAEIQWAMRCRKIHLYRAESGGRTEGHLGLVEKACHYLLEDHKDMLRRRGLGGFVGMSGDLCPFVAQVDDLFWVSAPVDSTLGELPRLDPPGVLGRIYSIMGPTPTSTAILTTSTAPSDVPDVHADSDLAPPTMGGEAVIEGSQTVEVTIDPTFQLFAQDAREFINEPHRLRGRSAHHFNRLQRSSHQCALIVSFREGVDVTTEILSNLASRIAYSTTSTYPSVPRKVIKLTVCGGGLGGDMSSSVFRHIIVAPPPPACKITTANPSLTYRATVSELALLPPMAGSQRGKRTKTENLRVSSAIGQSRGSTSVCSEKGVLMPDSVHHYHQPSLPDRLVGTTPFPPLGALRLYPMESVHIDDGDGDVGLVDWGGSTIELSAPVGMSILDSLVVLPEEQQRMADERVYQFTHQRLSAVREAQSRAREGRDAGSTRKGGRGRRATTSAADSSHRQIEPFDTVGSSLFHHLSRAAAHASADSDSDGLSDSPKPDPSVWDSWVAGGVKHWNDVENRLIAPTLPHSGASTASGTPATGSLPAGMDILSHPLRLFVRVEPPFELGAHPIIYGDHLVSNGRDGTFTTNEVNNAEWSVVRAIQKNFNAAETEGGVDGIIQYYSSTTSLTGGKSSLPTSRRGSSWSVSSIREQAVSESSTRTFHFVDEHGMVVMADAGTITLSRTISPPPKGEKPKSFKLLPGKAKPTKGIALSAATPALQTEDLKLTISFNEKGHITSNHLLRVLGSIGLFSHDPLKWQQSQYAAHDDRHSPKKSDGLTPDLLLHPSRMCITKKLSGFIKHRSGDVHEVPTISVRCEPPPITKQSGKTSASPAVISLRDISEPPSCPLFSLPATSGPKDVPLITWRGLTDRVTISCLDIFPVQGWCAERDSLQLRLSGSAFNLSPDGTVMCGREPIAKLTTSTPSFIRLEFDETANAPLSSKLDYSKSTTPEAVRLAKGAPAPQGFEPTGAAGSAAKQGASWGRVLLLLQCLYMAVDVKDGKDREVFPTEDRVICVQIVDPFAHRVSTTSGTGCPQYEVSQLLQRVVFLRSGEKALF